MTGWIQGLTIFWARHLKGSASVNEITKFWANIKYEEDLRYLRLWSGAPTGVRVFGQFLRNGGGKGDTDLMSSGYSTIWTPTSTLSSTYSEVELPYLLDA